MDASGGEDSDPDTTVHTGRRKTLDAIIDDLDEPAHDHPRSRVRQTNLFVTVNFQRTATDLSTGSVQAYLEEVLFSRLHIPSLLRIREDRLVNVNILAPTIEVSPKRNLVHTHFVMEVTHASQVKLGGLQRHWQNYIRHTVQPYFRSRGVYVSLDLLDGTAENYALKDQYV